MLHDSLNTVNRGFQRASFCNERWAWSLVRCRVVAESHGFNSHVEGNRFDETLMVVGVDYVRGEVRF